MLLDQESSYSYKSKEIIYLEHFKELKNIKLTHREIDVLACVLCNRGEKKIASLLLVSPKTINAHIYNIMQKLQVNSKDSIIDFIEKSGKAAILKQYYVLVLVENNFRTQLKKIGLQINQQVITCNIPIDKFTLDKKDNF